MRRLPFLSSPSDTPKDREEDDKDDWAAAYGLVHPWLPFDLLSQGKVIAQ